MNKQVETHNPECSAQLWPGSVLPGLTFLPVHTNSCLTVSIVRGKAKRFLIITNHHPIHPLTQAGDGKCLMLEETKVQS